MRFGIIYILIAFLVKDWLISSPISVKDQWQTYQSKIGINFEKNQKVDFDNANISWWLNFQKNNFILGCSQSRYTDKSYNFINNSEKDHFYFIESIGLGFRFKYLTIIYGKTRSTFPLSYLIAEAGYLNNKLIIEYDKGINNYHKYSVVFFKGEALGFFLGISQIRDVSRSEQSIYLGIQWKIGNVSTGINYASVISPDKKESTGYKKIIYFAYDPSENKTSGDGKEEKQEYNRQQQQVKKNTQHKQKIYPVSIDDLLQYGFTLRDAIIISKASRDEVEYRRIIKNLNSNYKKKLISLQYWKSKHEKK